MRDKEGQDLRTRRLVGGGEQCRNLVAGHDGRPDGGRNVAGHVPVGRRAVADRELPDVAEQQRIAFPPGRRRGRIVAEDGLSRRIAGQLQNRLEDEPP